MAPRQTVPFYKFRLSRLGQAPLTVGPLNRIYVFPRPSGSYNPSVDNAVLFVTPDGNPSPSDAQRELSITYNPGCRYTIDAQALIDAGFTAKDNLGREVTDFTDPAHEIPRVWPAFGCPGGRRELLFIPPDNDPNIQVPVGQELETGGGSPTLWYLDDSLPLSAQAATVSGGLAAGLSAAAWDRLQHDDAAPPQGVEGFPVVERDGVASITILLRGIGHRPRWATLSSAYVMADNATRSKTLGSLGVVEARFWIALWVDLGHERWLLDRAIEPIEQACICCLGQFDPADLARVAGGILLSRAVRVSDEFFSQAALPVKLPV